ncbi:MAG: alpha/beta fold hydrolase [Bacteroidota bacterium]
MNLFYRTVGEGPPLIILHGLFGSADNWRPLATRFAKFRKVYLVDQRNHGMSPHDNEFTYDAMVNDLLLFIKQHDLIKPDILGHSMGGKVAMYFAVKYPDQVNKIIVVDIAPKAYPVRHDEILDGLKTLRVEDILTRQEIDDVLAEIIESPRLRRFLLKNLKRNKYGFEWKMNLDVIYNKIANLSIGLNKGDGFSHDTLFIRGSDSDYILDSDIKSISSHFPKAELVTIENASHWVHVEEPDALCLSVKEFLLKK